MNVYKIAVIAGDGIGPEVITEGVRVLEEAARLDGGFRFEFTHFPWGCDYYKETGRMMPADGIEILKKFDAIFLGAVGAPGVPDHISLWDLLLIIRKQFDQYINLRPVKLLKGAPCPLKDAKPEDIDMIFVRENTEGEYAGSGSWLFKGKPNEVVIQDGVFSRTGCERVIRYAYQLARQEGKSLTSISKGNALNYSMVFWDQIFKEVGQEFPDVKTHSYLVDAASMFMVKDPARFEVVVTSNLFGCGHCRRNGSGGRRQSEPGAEVPLHVRAYPWICTGYCRQADRKSPGNGLVCFPDAGLLRSCRLGQASYRLH